MGAGGVATEWGVLDGGVNLEEMLPGVYSVAHVK